MRNFIGIACLAVLAASLFNNGWASAACGAGSFTIQDGEQPGQETGTAEDSVIKVLIEAAKDKNPSMRTQMINLLGGYIQDRADVLAPIVAAADDESHDVRVAALRQLMRLPDPSPELLTRIVELQIELRQLSTRGSSIKQHAEHVVPLLLDHLRSDADAESRSHVCQALGSLREDARSSLPMLLELVANADEDYQVRYAAANAAESIARFADAADEEAVRRANAPASAATAQSDRIGKFVESFIANSDRNGDNRLDKSEWPQTKMLDLAAADVDQDGILTIEEISDQLKKSGGSRN